MSHGKPFKKCSAQSRPISLGINSSWYHGATSVIYFGGYDWDEREESDRIVEYKNLKWTLLGNLASPRFGHRSIKMNNKIYIFGGNGT